MHREAGIGESIAEDGGSVAGSVRTESKWQEKGEKNKHPKVRPEQ